MRPLPDAESAAIRSAARACSTASDERTGRTLSEDNTVHAVGALIAFAAPPDFRDGLLDSREGPWEVTTPRSSYPGAELHSASGRTQPPVFGRINTVTETVVAPRERYLPGELNSVLRRLFYELMRRATFRASLAWGPEEP